MSTIALPMTPPSRITATPPRLRQGGSDERLSENVKMEENPPRIEAMPLYTNLDRIERGLAAQGIGPGDPIRPEQLFALDQWHYHGTEAIAAAARALGLGPQSRVLDVGAGVGGPARYLAHTTGCHVTALELQPELHAIGVDLTRRTGLADRVTHVCGDALAEPLPDAGFDAVVSWLAIVHIPERARLFRRLARALRSGGGCYVEDLCMHKPFAPRDWEDAAPGRLRQLAQQPGGLRAGSDGRGLLGCRRHRPHAGLGTVRRRAPRSVAPEPCGLRQRARRGRLPGAGTLLHRDRAPL